MATFGCEEGCLRGPLQSATTGRGTARLPRRRMTQSIILIQRIQRGCFLMCMFRRGEDI
jgi:hypothetical protein